MGYVLLNWRLRIFPGAETGGMLIHCSIKFRGYLSFMGFRI